MIMSDHNPLVIEVTFTTGPRKQWVWTFERKLLIDHEYISHMRKWIKQYWEINRYSTGAGMVWDALKAGVRGETCSFSLSRRKREMQRMEAQSRNLIQMEEELAVVIMAGGDAMEALNKLAWAKAEIGECITSKAADLFSIKKEQCYEYSERVGQVLANRLRQKEARNEINEIRDVRGKLTNDPLEIQETFRLFYQNLYATGPQIQADRIQDYLKKIAINRLDPEASAKLEEELSQEEILNALISLPSGKAAGPDQIPLEFYKIFVEEIGPDLGGASTLSPRRE